ncbi:leucine-rich repeat domain-containing protein [Blautia sp. MSK.20.9]|nr:leucine-rich repeat domain-containing protein [Blautia sp. MSK.20.9]
MDRIYGNESGISYCYDNGGVTFYCSDVYTCRDIDMASNVKRVCFGEDNNTNQMYYKLRYSCMIFPNVTEIYIARNVAAIEINNRMFPNCRKIVSNNVNYRSGSMLVKKDKAMDWNFLLNAFCLKKGEDVDLTGIDMIKSGAFSGCEIVEIKNVADLSQVEKYAFSDSDFCSDKNKAVGGFRMAGPIIVEMLPDLEEYEIPDYAIYTAPRAVKAMQKMHKAKRLIINNLAATVNVLCTTRLPKKVIVKNIKKRTDDTDYDLFDILDSETTEEIELQNCSPEYKSINGLLYGRVIDEYGFFTKTWSVLRCPRGMKKAVIDDIAEEIAQAAFMGCSVEEVVMPDSVKMICNEAFSCCKYLKKINLSKNLQKITNQLGNNACFKKCESLKGIEIPAGIKEIPNMIFFGCSELSEVVFHDGLEVIGASAFASCRKLKKVSLPETVKRIKRWAIPYVDELHLASNVIPDGLVLGLNSSASSAFCARVIFPDGKEVFVSKTVNSDVEDKATLQLSKHCQDPDWYIYSSDITSLRLNGLTEYERRLKAPEEWPDSRPKQAELKRFLHYNSVALMDWLSTHNKRQSLAKLICYGFLPDSALSDLLMYANEHNMPDIAAYTIQQMQKEKTDDTEFHI